MNGDGRRSIGRKQAKTRDGLRVNFRTMCKEIAMNRFEVLVVAAWHRSGWELPRHGKRRPRIADHRNQILVSCRAYRNVAPLRARVVRLETESPGGYTVRILYSSRGGRTGRRSRTDGENTTIG